MTREGFKYEAEARKPPAPNMALLYLATYIKSRCRADVKIIEMGAAQCSHEDVAKRIDEKLPDIVGFTSMSFNIGGVYHLAEKTISFSKKIIISFVS